MSETNPGGGGNSFSKYITIKSYDDFLTEIHKNDEVRNRYFYEMLQWAEHSRHQKNVRLARFRKKKKAREEKEAEAITAAMNAPAPAPVPTLTVPNTPRVIQLYQGEPKRRGSTLSIPDSTLFPKSR